MTSIKHDLKSEINRLIHTKPKERSKYYQLSLFSNDDGKFHYSMTSRWVGFTKEGPRREIREASLVNPVGAIELFKSIGEPVFVINTKKDLQLFMFLTGGHAIITKTIADKYLSHLLKPEVFAYSFDDGFVSLNSIPKEKLNHAPNRKLRIRVFNRDKRRCKICGSSPEKNEHIELHLHHIIPYGSGGITDENNLITLCHTCHKGLEPHTDYSLFNSIGVDMLAKRLRKNPYDQKIEMNIRINLLRASKQHK